jgi:hypothetical protein
LDPLPTLNTPVHSPDQFDFGEVWDGDVARKTFHIVANASGFVTVDIPAGPFHVSEFREMGEAKGGSKNMGTGKGPTVPIQPVKVRNQYPDGRTGLLQWKLDPGADVQIDVVFQPHFKFGSEMAGLKSATMKVSGPGPKFNWTLSLPLRGMFDGLKVTAPLAVDLRSLYAVAGEKATWIQVTVTGLGTDVSGTIRSDGAMPPEVSILSTKVQVPAGKSVTKIVPVVYDNFPADAVTRSFQLAFDDGSRTSKTQIDFAGLPASMALTSGDRKDCGVSHAQMTVQMSAPHAERWFDSQGKPASSKGTAYGSVTYVLQGSNFDALDRRYVWMVAESGGVQITDGTLALYERKVDATKDQPVTGELMAGRNGWAQIVRGPARVGCQRSELAGPPKVKNLTWAPAQ